MKLNKTLTALAVSASFGLSGQAFALGTEAGTEIQNQATLSFSVGSTTQTPVTDTAQFKVDNKVDMSLSWDTSGLQAVAAGQTAFHKFTITNTGNLDQPYDLSAVTAASGTEIIAAASPDPAINSDTVPSSGPIFTFYEVDTQPTVGVTTTTTSLTSVPHASGSNSKIFWVGVQYPLTANLEDTNKIANFITVTADTSGNGNNAAADKNSNLDEQLFVNADGAGPNDAANDAAISAVFGDEITTANFSDSTDGLKLNVIVVNDPICNADNANYGVSGSHDSGTSTTGVMDCNAATAPASYTPKAIPGALVEYTITAKNTGRAQAESVSFAQDLNTLVFSGLTASTPLQANSIDHVVATMAGGAGGNNGGVNAVNNSTTSALDVDVATFDSGADITITFTAIVE